MQLIFDMINSINVIKIDPIKLKRINKINYKNLVILLLLYYYQVRISIDQIIQHD